MTPLIYNGAEYFDADCADYAEIKYQTSAESAKSASKILNQIEWRDTSHPTAVQEHLSEIQKGGTRNISIIESGHPAWAIGPPYKINDELRNQNEE